MYHSQTSKEVRFPKDASGSAASRNAPDTDNKQVYSLHTSTNQIPSNADHGKISANSEKFQREFRDEMIIKILTETQWILWRTSVGSKLKSLYPTTDLELLLSNDDIFRKKLRKAFRDTINRSRCCEATREPTLLYQQFSHPPPPRPTKQLVFAQIFETRPQDTAPTMQIVT